MLEDGTPAERKAMKLLLALGELNGADRLIPVTSAHISGASYKIVGDPGLEFLEEFSQSARVKVRTTVNPVGMDLRSWRDTGIPEDFAARQLEIVQAYRRMGVEETWSCIPYQVGHRPRRGEHVAWAESSASIFANSVLGARTNRESGPSALAAAVTGWTPNYGLHLDEGRRATVRIRVDAGLQGYEFSLLGYHIGRILGSGVPYLQGLEASEDQLKAIGAAMATSSEIDMFHVEGVTPEWEAADSSDLDVVTVTRAELEEAKERLMSARDYQLIAFGCPQLSERELVEVAELMERHRPRVPVWAFTSRKVAEREARAVRRIEELGGRVVLDTCPEVMPLNLVAMDVGSPSAKAAVYLPSLSGQRVAIEDAERLMREKA